MSGQKLCREVALVKAGKLPAAASLRIKAALAKVKDGEIVEVQIKRWGTRTSDKQRGYWFAVIVPAYDQYFGMDDEDETHNELMERFWPEGRHEKTLPDGRIRVLRASLNDLSTIDCGVLFERAWSYFALECGGSLPSPGEYGAKEGPAEPIPAGPSTRKP